LRQFSFVLSLPVIISLAACGGNAPETVASAPPATEAAATPAVTTAEPDVAPLFGSWGYDAPACTSPIVISASAFEGAENSCEISGFEQNGDGSFTASLSCSSQGQAANERVAMTPIFGPQGEGVRLAYLDRGGDPVTVFRCRAARAD
jgi:hypothetical protein